MTTRTAIDLTVNGRTQTVLVEPRTTLADAMRQEMGLTGTHLACEHGVCGACTVLADGEPVRSCLMLAVQAADVAITTVEGLATDGEMHPIQEAMWDAHSFQCGFCTPGFVMTVAAMLADNPSPTETEVREELSGNLCRCTGYQSIVDGVLLAAARMRGESGDGILPSYDHG